MLTREEESLGHSSSSSWVKRAPMSPLSSSFFKSPISGMMLAAEPTDPSAPPLPEDGRRFLRRWRSTEELPPLPPLFVLSRKRHCR